MLFAQFPPLMFHAGAFPLRFISSFDGLGCLLPIEVTISLPFAFA